MYVVVAVRARLLDVQPRWVCVGMQPHSCACEFRVHTCRPCGVGAGPSPAQACGGALWQLGQAPTGHVPAAVSSLRATGWMAVGVC